MLVDGFDQKEERLKMLSEGGFKNNSSEPSYFPTVCVCLRGTIVSIAFSSGLLQSSTREWGCLDPRSPRHSHSGVGRSPFRLTYQNLHLLISLQ